MERLFIVNKLSAKEWLIKAFHNIKAVTVLFENDVYTDIIGCELQQSIEKTLKSVLAFNNKPIKKTHNLVELLELVKNNIDFEVDIKLLIIATDYYTENRYPNSYFDLPEKKEIEEILNFTKELFKKICLVLDINI